MSSSRISMKYQLMGIGADVELLETLASFDAFSSMASRPNAHALARDISGRFQQQNLLWINYVKAVLKRYEKFTCIMFIIMRMTLDYVNTKY